MPYELQTGYSPSGCAERQGADATVSNWRPNAFNDLVTRYRNRVFTVIYGMVRNEQEAWDLAQKSFLRA
jgi:DNA-directed RNA polymerase specialized sigma24 family protein